MKLLFILLLSINIYAMDKLYFFPKDAQKARNHIAKLINTSKNNIDIAMYNFGDKKFAKLLNSAHKRGVKVKIFYSKKNVKLNDISIKITDKKLHTKIAIFDKKIVIFGSPNWTKKSFKDNYEILYITDDKKIVSKFNKFFKELY